MILVIPEFRRLLIMWSIYLSGVSGCLPDTQCGLQPRHISHLGFLGKDPDRVRLGLLFSRIPQFQNKSAGNVAVSEHEVNTRSKRRKSGNPHVSFLSNE